MKISEFLKERRRSLRLSQADLAARLTLRGHSTTKQSVGHWETERNNPPLEEKAFRQALASSLDIDVNEMMEKLDYIATDDQRSAEALLAAEIVDELPTIARAIAIDQLQALRKRFVEHA